MNRATMSMKALPAVREPIRLALSCVAAAQLSHGRETPPTGNVESIGQRPAAQGSDEEQIMMAKRILVPLDGSESAEAAASLAADLARGSGGDVRLLQVHPVPESPG